MSTKKSNTKKETVKELDFQNLTDEQILSLDLDKINLKDLLSNNKSLRTAKVSKGKKGGLYKSTAKKENESDKNFRSRIRDKRNSFIENTFRFFEADNKTELKAEFDAFMIFYKETYNVNDFSLESLCRLNSDKATQARIKTFFKVLRLAKLIK